MWKLDFNSSSWLWSHFLNLTLIECEVTSEIRFQSQFEKLDFGLWLASRLWSQGLEWFWLQNQKQFYVNKLNFSSCPVWSLRYWAQNLAPNSRGTCNVLKFDSDLISKSSLIFDSRALLQIGLWTLLWLDIKSPTLCIIKLQLKFDYRSEPWLQNIFINGTRLCYDSAANLHLWLWFYINSGANLKTFRTSPRLLD